MELKKAILERRSIRKYKEGLIDREVIKEIVEAARFYPSWKNTQIARFVVVEDRDIINRIANEGTYNFEYNMKTLNGAAELLVLTYVKNRSGFERDGSYTTSKGDRWEMFDSGICAQTFSLLAHEKGIGTCILGIFEEEKVKEILGLGEDMGVACLITMGMLNGEEVPAPKRKEVDEILSFK